MNSAFKKSRSIMKLHKDEELALASKHAEEKEQFLQWLDLPTGTLVHFWTASGVWHMGRVTKAPFFDPDLRTVSIDLDHVECGGDEFWIFPERYNSRCYLNFHEWKLALNIPSLGGLYDLNVEISPTQTLGEMYRLYVERVGASKPEDLL